MMQSVLLSASPLMMRRCAASAANQTAAFAAVVTVVSSTTAATTLCSSSLATSSPSSSSTAAVMTEQQRFIHKGNFKGPDRMLRIRNTNRTTTMWNSNKYGGRLARLREVRPTYRRSATRQFSNDPQIIQYNLDVFNAQQTLRKKWKARDWEAVELPFELAPKVLQKVIPEMYSAPPMPADPASGDYSNIRAKVFDREALQLELFTDAKANGGKAIDTSNLVLPYPAIRTVDPKAMTLDKFL